MVEHLDGSSGMIVRRVLIMFHMKTRGLIKKAWLYDLQKDLEC